MKILIKSAAASFTSQQSSVCVSNGILRFPAAERMLSCWFPFSSLHRELNKPRNSKNIYPAVQQDKLRPVLTRKREMPSAPPTFLG